MKLLKSVPFLICLFLLACQIEDGKDERDKEEWVSLFNGVDLTGWDIKMSGFPLNENHLETFVVEDSMIRIQYVNYDTFDEAYGHMYYKKPFSYYKIRFDYRFVGEQTPGGASWNVRNSGIMLHSQSAESNEFDQDFPVSVELQLLGGLGEGERTTANVCTPGTAVMMGDTVNYYHCINSNSKTYDGDQWVHVEAIVKGGESMDFIVEGDTVLSFQKPQIGGGFISKQRDWASFGLLTDSLEWMAREGEILTEGYIALQAESHPIDFKNIELLNLCGCMDPFASSYKTYYLKDDPESCKY
ncbi:MAG: DUF1080 domain-containing protein [Bacteroidota bacterium]